MSEKDYSNAEDLSFKPDRDTSERTENDIRDNVGEDSEDEEIDVVDDNDASDDKGSGCFHEFLLQYVFFNA